MRFQTSNQFQLHCKVRHIPFTRLLLSHIQCEHLAAVVSLQSHTTGHQHQASKEETTELPPWLCLKVKVFQSNLTFSISASPGHLGPESTAASHHRTPRTSSSESHRDTHNQLDLIQCFELAPMCMLQRLENLEGTHTDTRENMHGVHRGRC